MVVFELVISLAMLCGFIGLLIMSAGLPVPATYTFFTGPGAFPIIISIVLIILTVIWIADVLKTKKKAGITAGGTAADAGEAGKKLLLEDLVGDKGQQKRLLIVMLSTLIFIFVLIPVCGKISELYGFLIAVFIFLTGTLKIFGQYGWGRAVIISLTAAAIVFVVFRYALMLPMPY